MKTESIHPTGRSSLISPMLQIFKRMNFSAPFLNLSDTSEWLEEGAGALGILALPPWLVRRERLSCAPIGPAVPCFNCWRLTPRGGLAATSTKATFVFFTIEKSNKKHVKEKQPHGSIWLLQLIKQILMIENNYKTIISESHYTHHSHYYILWKMPSKDKIFA